MVRSNRSSSQFHTLDLGASSYTDTQQRLRLRHEPPVGPRPPTHPIWWYPGNNTLRCDPDISGGKGTSTTKAGEMWLYFVWVAKSMNDRYDRERGPQHRKAAGGMRLKLGIVEGRNISDAGGDE